MVQARDEAGEMAEFTGLGRQGPDMSPRNVGSEGLGDSEAVAMWMAGWWNHGSHRKVEEEQVSGEDESSTA